MRGVIFDFGNTLFAHASLALTISTSARTCGAEVSVADAAALAARIEAAAHAPDELALGRDLDASVWATRWRVLYSIADTVAPGMGDEIHRLMHAPDQWVPYTATLGLLQRLHEGGMRVGVLSNTGWDVRSVFRHHDADRFVHAFALSYEIGAVKPQPEAFARACELLGVEPADTLMVGDDTAADAGAARAGLRTLLLPLAVAGSDNGVGVVARLVG